MNRAHPNTQHSALLDGAAQWLGLGPSINLNGSKLNDSVNEVSSALDQLELFELEARVLYSASPIPVDLIDAGQAPDSAMDANTTDAATLTAASSAVAVPVAQPLTTGSVVTVDTTADVADGDVSSIDALLANRGADGQISLREAIQATNNTPNVGGLDLIRFAISESDPGRLYYRDDGISGSLSLVATPTVSDDLIADFDPDYISTPFSWFRIGLTSTLDAITDAVIIDGYSQSNANVNTLAIGNDAILRVEITNATGSTGSFNMSNDGLILNQNSDGSVIQGLVINGFENTGIMVQQDANDITIRGNFVGTDVTGTQANANVASGVFVNGFNVTVGGADPSDRNIISGNGGDGITFRSSGTIIGGLLQNNYIGVDATGLNPLGNGNFGVQLSNTIDVDVINNVISGNEFDGIRAEQVGSVTNSTIARNLIGVAADGTTPLGNEGSGIRISSQNANGIQIGGSDPTQANVIGDNAFFGIALDGTTVSSTTILNNLIGTDAGRTLNLGNGLDGILLINGASSTQIGSGNPDQGNVITNNGGAGVSDTFGFNFNSGNSNTILGNQIFDNNGLAIDRSDGFVPVVTNAGFDTGLLSVDVEFAGTANTEYTFEFFSHSSATPSGRGEAETFIGSMDAVTDANGVAIFQFSTAIATVEQFVAVTATEAFEGTSELSSSQRVAPAPVIDNRQLTLNEGAVVTLTSNNLSTTDLERNTDFIVDNVVDGFFALQSAPTLAITSFTQGQIIDGAVIFVDNGDETSPSFDVAVTNSVATVGPLPALINFTNVNDPPVAIDNILVAIQDTPLPINLSALFNDVDSPNSEINFDFDDPINGTITRIANSSGLDEFTFTPNANFNGVEVINFTVSDGSLTDQAQLTINVQPRNDAPVAMDGEEDTSEDLPFLINLSALFNDVDSPNSEINFDFDNPVNGTITQIATPSGLDEFTFTPNANFNGVEAINFTVSDGSLTDQAQLTINVESVNDAPTVIDNITRTTFVGTSVTGNTLDNASDVDNDPLTFIFGNQSGSGIFNATINGDFEFIPDSQSGGTTTIEFNAFDGVELSNSGTLTFVVTAPPPVPPPNVSVSNDESEDAREDPEREDPSIIATNVPEPITPTEIALAKPELINFENQTPVVNNDESNAQTTNTRLLFPEFTYYFRPTQVDDLVDEQATKNISATETPQEKRGPLFTALDNLSDELDSISNNFATSELATTVTLSGVSIGLVSWILHGGALAASMLANLPAWRMIDPIAVLGYRDEENEENEENDESLLDIVDNPEATEVSAR